MAPPWKFNSGFLRKPRRVGYTRCADRLALSEAITGTCARCARWCSESEPPALVLETRVVLSRPAAMPTSAPAAAAAESEGDSAALLRELNEPQLAPESAAARPRARKVWQVKFLAAPSGPGTPRPFVEEVDDASGCGAFPRRRHGTAGTEHTHTD
eukprot:SAG22_NODE_1089_length_5599_cov_19.018179_6_plen_156_part_00